MSFRARGIERFAQQAEASLIDAPRSELTVYAQRMRKSSLVTSFCFSMWKLLRTGSPPFNDKMK
jgi:hypothetical protein